MLIKNIQLLRALAANAVLVSHLIDIETRFGHGIVVLPTAVHFGVVGVDLFFVISGFIMAMVAQNISARKFFLDRVTRIYPPYWFYTILTLIGFALIGSLVNQQASFWRSFFLFPDSVKPYLVVGWTLVHEIYFYVCFTCILGLVSRFAFPKRYSLLLWAAALTGANLWVRTNAVDSPLLAIETHPKTLEFISGAFIGLAINKKFVFFAEPALLLGTLSLLVLSATPYESIDLDDHESWLRLVLVGLPCALIVYGAASLEIKRGIAAPAWLVTIGNASYSTYLCHVPLLFALGRLYAIMPVSSNLFVEAFFVVFCIVLANTGGICSYRWLERPAMIYARKRLPTKFYA